MLISYVIGNLLGRLLMSYLLVWIVCVAIRKGDWRAALKLTKRWYVMIIILIIFFLGVAGTVTVSA